MRDRGWSRDCQPLPARRAAAHQQEDEIAQAVEHSDASRRAASAGPPRAVRARADLAGGDVVRAVQSCRRGRWRSRPAVQTPAQCAAAPADVHDEKKGCRAGHRGGRAHLAHFRDGARRASDCVDRSIQNIIRKVEPARSSRGCPGPTRPIYRLKVLE